MPTLKVKKNKNQFTPKGNFIPIPTIYLNKDTWKGHITFTEESKYILDDVDQGDTNKGYGVSWNILDNHDIAIMLGWRYNSQLDKFQLTLYWHNGDYPHHNWLTDEQGSLTYPVEVASGEKVYYTITVDADGYVVG